MRGDTRFVHSDACLNRMLNTLRHYEVVVGMIIAGRQGRGEDDSFDSRRETRSEKFRRSHIEVAPDAPRPTAHLKLVLEMVKDDPINRASALLPMLTINREANEAAVEHSSNLSDADAMGDPVIHQIDLVPSTSAEDRTPTRGAVSEGAHGRRKRGGPAKMVGAPDLGGNTNIHQASLL